MRNEELGIDALAPPWRVLFCASMPRAVPTADGVCTFRRSMERGVEIGNVRGLGC
ncbi:MAG: hypothetical protein U0L67_09855 [Paludibacteraceae bacterium]|nr:hypothetical protein [Paludibacteraceae bacterium]